MSDFNTRIDFYIGLTSQTGNVLDRADVIQDHVVPALADYAVDGFTLVQGIGYWKGVAEDCLIVTVFCGLAKIWAESLAARLARELDQEAVLVSASSCVANLIGG